MIEPYSCTTAWLESASSLKFNPSLAQKLLLCWLSLKWRSGVLRQCRFRPFGAGIFKVSRHWSLSIRWIKRGARKSVPRAPDHRLDGLDEPTRLSLSVIASLQSLPLFQQAESL